MTAFLTALDLAKSYQNGTACPVATLDAIYANLDKAPYAFISLTQERAYAEATAAKVRWQAGRPLSVFDGVPIAYKDLFDIANTTTTAGAKVRQNAPTAKQDADCVARLSRMGLVCVGKTNLSEFAYSGLGLNPHFGTPTNVKNPKHIAGGSSSGSATVVASGLLPLALGTDTAGSVRIPAAFNGIIGFRASRHHYDKTGVFPLAESLDTVGTFARSVRDVWLLDGLLHNKPSLDWLDDPNSPTDFTRPIIYDRAIVALADESVQQAFYAWLDRLMQQGITIKSQHLNALHDTLACITHQWLGSAEAYALHETLLNSSCANDLDPRVRTRLLLAKDIKASTQIRLYQARKVLQDKLKTELGDGLFAMPTVSHTAPELTPLEQDDDHFTKINLKTLKLTMLGAFLDMPALNIPIGTDTQDLPIGALLSSVANNDKLILDNGCLLDHLL